MLYHGKTKRHYQYYYHVVVLWYITVYHGLPWMATRYYHMVLPLGLTMVIPCGIPWCNCTTACCVIGLQPTAVSFFDCRNCRPMYSAGMWRRFSVAGTQWSAIGENCLTSTSAQHHRVLQCRYAKKRTQSSSPNYVIVCILRKGCGTFAKYAMFILQCNKCDICGWTILN